MNQVYRKEIKYPISLLEFYRVRKRLACYVRPDPYSGELGYRVRSLYFDSLNDLDLFDALNGNMEKRKIRLRFYPPDTGSIRLEYKCKSGSDGVKRSLKLTKEQAQLLISGDYSLLSALQEPLALELYTRLSMGGYYPKVIVDYHRLAYTYPVGNTRITFDSAVSASYAAHSFFDEQPGLVPLVPTDFGVLEVKFDDFLVGIIKEAVASVDTLATANSKYVQSRFLF